MRFIQINFTLFLLTLASCVSLPVISTPPDIPERNVFHSHNNYKNIQVMHEDIKNIPIKYYEVVNINHETPVLPITHNQQPETMVFDLRQTTKIYVEAKESAPKSIKPEENTKSWYESLWQWFISFINQAVFGSLMIGVIALIYTRRLEKQKLTYQLIESYNDKYFDSHREWVNILSHVNNSSDLQPENYNKLLKYANWCESVATLYLSKSLNKKLFEELGLKKIVIEAKEDIQERNLMRRFNFKYDFKNMYNLKE